MESQPRRISIAEYTPEWSGSANEERQSLSPKISQVDQACRKFAAEEALQRHKRRFGWFFAMVVIGFGLHIAGMATRHWFTNSENTKVSTQDGHSLQRNTVFGMGLRGLLLLQEYCEDGKGCTKNIDQFRAFDDSENPASFKWSRIKLTKEYMEPVNKAKSAGVNVIDGAYAGAALMFVAILTMSCGMCNHPWSKVPRALYCFVSVMHLAGCLAMGATVGAYIHFTSDLRDVMKEHSLIPSTAPEMQMGYSLFLTIAGISLCHLALVPMCLSTPEAIGENIADKKMKERDRRVSSYFFDMANSTHLKESAPVDNAPDAKGIGWTKRVVSAEMDGLNGAEAVPKISQITVAKNKSATEVCRDGDQEIDHDIEVPYSGGPLEWSRMKRKPPRRATVDVTTGPTSSHPLGVTASETSESVVTSMKERARKVTRAPMPPKQELPPPVRSDFCTQQQVPIKPRRSSMLERFGSSPVRGGGAATM